MSQRVLIVDDHLAIQKGLAQLFHAHFPAFETAAAGSAEEARAALKEGSWNLAVVDLNLGSSNGMDFITLLKDESPDTGILVYTMHAAMHFGIRCLRAGADGYLSKDSKESEFVEAVQSILAGRRYVCTALAEVLASTLVRPSRSAPHQALSDREFEILRKLSSGFTPSQIAEELHLSIKTISTYRTRVLEKLQLKTTAEMIRYALDNQLMEN